jgi:hypothetical protein
MLLLFTSPCIYKSALLIIAFIWKNSIYLEARLGAPEFMVEDIVITELMHYDVTGNMMMKLWIGLSAGEISRERFGCVTDAMLKYIIHIL